MPLYQHMRDSAATAGVLWERWLPGSTRSLLAGAFGSGLARKRMLFLAAVHDVGKATPVFAQQSAPDFARMVAAGLPRPKVVSDKGELWHSTASLIILERFLVERGWDEGAAVSWGAVPGSHHGMTPDLAYWKLSDRPHLMGSDLWTQVQDELVQFALDVAGLTEADLADLSGFPLTKQQQVIATSVVILADWLASDTDRFPLDGHDAERTDAALATVGLPPHWSPQRDDSDAAVFYGDRFGSPGRAFVPRPSQVAALDVARSVSVPGLMIVEAPMGEGKTEIGLAVAEVFAERVGAGGVFMALPTMSTADAIFSQRFSSWVERRVAGSGNPASVYLAHSRASMNDDFAAVPVQGKLAQICDEEHGTGLVAHEWLTGGKKGVLASFVVGTIDQILIAALRSRHVMLRHLALLNKVVVIDEVHAADTYMSVYLDRALTWLGEYGIPVVLLSATLPSVRRAELVAAYAPTADVTEVAAATGYPLITATDGDNVVLKPAAASGRSLKPEIIFIDEDADLASIIGSTPGITAVIRNTVDRAQQTAEQLRSALPGCEVILAHSRFVAQDRARIERGLRDRLGTDSSARPARLVVVGTQVLEQSLDVDFDQMFTDAAPTDIILQRMGRLHRHDRPDRHPSVAVPRCFIIGAPGEDIEAGLAANPSQFIYPPYVLARSAQVLRAAGGSIRLPADIPLMVNATYDLTAIPPELIEYLKLWEAAQFASKTHAEGWLLADPAWRDDLIGWLIRSAGQADDEATLGRASVRETEDSLEVVVAERGADGILRTLHHLPNGQGGLALSETARSDFWNAKVLATTVLRLPKKVSRGDVVAALEEAKPASWAKSTWLKRAALLVLDSNWQAHVPGATLTYTDVGGLTVQMDYDT